MKNTHYKRLMAEAKKELNSPLICYLNTIFENRRCRNPRYSLRAFARDLNISAGKLSEILSAKYAPGSIVTKRICDSLKLSHSEQEEVASFVRIHEELILERDGPRVLQDDELALIANFEHYSMMSLFQTVDFRSEPEWMAGRLGISVDAVIEVLERLLRIGLIEVVNDRYFLTFKNLTTSHSKSSDVLKEAHRQLIDHARDCISTVPVEDRDITSITFAIDKNRILEAKSVLRDCRRTLADLFESGEKNEVYNLNIQLVPVTKSLGGSV